jgi:cytochrome c
MKRFISIFIIISVLFMGSMAMADDKATAKDVYDLVIKAYDVVKALKDESLVAFNDPKGEFIYKDTYVYVMQCPEYVVAHPYAYDKLKGKDLRKIYPFQNTLCEGGKSAQGTWVEYNWPKPGSKESSRKISFVIGVEGTPYTIAAGIYNDDLSIAELMREKK